jgi:acetoacetyl-CoA synthetase
VSQGDVLWTPRADVREATWIGRYAAWLERERGMAFADYDELWRWSVSDLEGFWGSIWDYFGVRSHAPYERVLGAREMPGASWFPGARINYAEHMVGLPEDAEAVAVVARSQTRGPLELTFGELAEQVARARTGLQRLGVGPGDRVVGYLPNAPETLVAFMATASLGAVWATCAAEFGARSVIDRFGQLDPKVLLAVGGYGFRDRSIDRRGEVAAIRAGLPTLEHVVGVPYGEHEVPDATLQWSELLAEPGELAFDPVPFDHPLCVLFSSGTTGLPKAIVHGHGGLLVEHLKSGALHWDLGPGDRLLQFTTTSWMMWNALVSALLLRASIVLLDGDPTWPDLGAQWRLADEVGATAMGTSPTFVMACRKAEVPIGDLPLERLRIVVTAGSPLPAAGYEYLYEQLGGDILLLNGSGGTDVCSGLVSGSFWQTVYEGELSGPCLGVDAKAFDPEGEPIVGELGELVVTQPLPSMPVAIWNDPDGERYRTSYFETYPGVWRQGDWIRFTERGSCVITGRSDATLNRAGVRLGTSEIYTVVEELPEIADSLIVHLEDPDGGGGELLLFVTPAEGAELDDDVRDRIARALRAELSPRHVPDTIAVVPAIPRTLTGKKLEAPVKRILQGAAADAVVSRGALADPGAIDAIVAFAGRPR